MPPKAVERDEPRPFKIAAGRQCGIEAAGGEKKLGTFEGVAYTGAQMRPQGWWNDVVIDLKGVRVKSQKRPVLRQHDHEQIVGHTTAITVDPKDGIKVAGVFSGEQQHVDKVVVPGKNDFPWQLSVGAEPVRTEFLEAGEETEVNGRTVKGPTTISRETEFGEVSFVPLGADGDTSATIAAQKGSTMNQFATALKHLKASEPDNVEAAKYSDASIDKMTAKEARAALKKCMASDEEEEEEDEDEEEAPPKKKKKSKSTKTNSLHLSVDTKSLMKDMRKVYVADLIRQKEITAACRRHDVTELELELAGGKKTINLAEHAIENDWTVDQVKGVLLDHIRLSRPTGPIGVPGGLGYVTNTPAMNEAVLEAAVFQAARHQFRLDDSSFYFDTAPDGTPVRRVPKYMQDMAQTEFKARYTDQVQQAAHTLFKGIVTPQQLLAAAFQAKGLNAHIDFRSEGGITSMLATWDRAEPRGIRAEGSSNLSISNVLANVLNKFALQGYLFVEQAWRIFCAIRPVTDFKATKSINLLGDVMYQKVGAAGEISNASLGDQAFANQADPYARIITIPWTHLVNDDLSILTGVPMKIGQGAGLKTNDVIWTLWKNMAAGTVNGDDGTSFWRTSVNSTVGAKSQKNKITGASSALSSASLQTAKAVFDSQTDPNGNPLGFDGTTPILLHGQTNFVTAQELVGYRELIGTGQTATPKQPNGNIWAGRFKPAMSRYMENASYGNSATAWAMLYDPIALAIIEVCFLNGIDTPTVLQAGPDYQFDRLGISIRGTLAMGATQQNFRGGVYSAGA